jgi:hypothetical protein
MAMNFDNGEMSELAEGARLEIVCAVKSGTEGSNPSLSARKIGTPIYPTFPGPDRFCEIEGLIDLWKHEAGDTWIAIGSHQGGPTFHYSIRILTVNAKKLQLRL